MLNFRKLRYVPGSLRNRKKVFISLGANDIRYCRSGVNHLRKYVKQLVMKVKQFFPNAKIIIQSLLPQRVAHNQVIRNILQFNRILFSVCSEEEIYYMDVMNDFLDNDLKYINQRLFHDGLHPSRQGYGRLARWYIYNIHKNRFNPLLK